jgi:hypothetical protein
VFGEDVHRLDPRAEQEREEVPEVGDRPPAGDDRDREEPEERQGDRGPDRGLHRRRRRVADRAGRGARTSVAAATANTTPLSPTAYCRTANPTSVSKAFDTTATRRRWRSLVSHASAAENGTQNATLCAK